jgi:ABC-type lipoprotein export system ATPase subunit
MPVKDKFMQKLAGERAWQLLEKVGLSGLANRRPGQMSPGECQRAAVVRALVNQPRLLLADEPTGSLDAQNACQLGELIAALNHDNDLAVLVVTHSMELASLMEKNYRLTSGLLNLIERE